MEFYNFHIFKIGNLGIFIFDRNINMEHRYWQNLKSQTAIFILKYHNFSSKNEISEKWYKINCFDRDFWLEIHVPQNGPFQEKMGHLLVRILYLHKIIISTENWLKMHDFSSKIEEVRKNRSKILKFLAEANETFSLKKI